MQRGEPLNWCISFEPQQASPFHGGCDFPIYRGVHQGSLYDTNPRSALPSLKLTWHLKMDGWKTSFLLGRPIFRGYVSFREGNYIMGNSRKYYIHIKAMFDTPPKNLQFNDPCLKVAHQETKFRHPEAPAEFGFANFGLT